MEDFISATTSIINTIVGVFQAIINVAIFIFNLPIIKILRLIGGILSLVLFIFWIYLIIKTNKITDVIEKYKTIWVGGHYEKRRVLRAWKEIHDLLKEDDIQSYKLAFSLLNELLEEVINRLNPKGKNLLEKIKSLKIAELNEIEKSKLLVGVYAYDKLKSDPTFNLEPKEVKYFVKLYKEFFERLHILGD
ncbi:MAG: hypothetical protein N2692_00790 [Patescibacteria group bacterium]|jgi:hypothetical protein|nr:hypothetical protein [Patescibacteria group bacterium]